MAIRELKKEKTVALKSSVGNVLVFDADDTLWMLEWLYSKSYSTFFSFVYGVFGPMAPNLASLQEAFFKIEGRLYPEWGVKRGRVAEAMVLTYREVCRWAKMRFGRELYTKQDEERIRDIGDIPFDYTHLTWLPEARRALSILRQRGDMLCLLSSYDSTLFPAKAEFLKIGEFFALERMRTTEIAKTKEDFIAASGWTPETDKTRLWFAVGNSESDIVPALEISGRWRGIYVPHGSTSAYFKHKDRFNGFNPFPSNDDRITTLQSLRDMPKLMESF